MAATSDAVPLDISPEAGGKDDLPLTEFEVETPPPMPIRVPSPRPWDSLGVWLALGGMFVIVTYTWFLIFSNNPSKLKWFALHPTFQVLGLGLFLCGTLILQTTSIAQPRAKLKAASRHQTIMFVMAFPLMIAGTSVIMWNKTVHEKNHFTSWHGTFGLLCFIWMFLQVAVGGGTVWFGGRAFGRNPKAFYKYHRLSGYLLLSLYLLTVHIGGSWSHFTTDNASFLMRIIVFTISPILVLVGIWSRARWSKMSW